MHLAVTYDRLDAARRAWSEAYRERERALILELARSKDTLIGMTMQPMTGGEDAGAASAAISAGIARRSNQRAPRFRPQGGAPSSGSRGPPPAPEQLER